MRSLAFVLKNVLIGAVIGLVLWSANIPAQVSAPERPGLRVQLVLRSDALQLFGADGRELFAIAEDGTVELSGDATIDFSPAMRAAVTGPLAGAIRVRVGGKLYTLQLFEDVGCTPGPSTGCPIRCAPGGCSR